MLRAQRWMLDHAERVIDAVVAETGKTYEDAQLTDLGYTVQALGFWAKSAERYLADERVHYWGNPTVAGKKLVVRYEPTGVVGVIGPWNFPLVNGFGDCIPALMAGNSVILKPSEVTPLSSLLMAEMFARVWAAGGRLPGRDRRRLDRRGAGGGRRLRDVHRLDAHRQARRQGCGRRADPVSPRARRQGSDDRLRRRRHREGGQRRGVTTR